MRCMLILLKKYYALLPILYLFVSVFLARNKVQYVYILSLLLVLLTLLASYRNKTDSLTFLAR